MKSKSTVGGAASSYATTKINSVGNILCNVICAIPLTLLMAVWGTLVWRYSHSEEVTNSSACNMKTMETYILITMIINYVDLGLLMTMSYMTCVGILVPVICDIGVICLQIVVFVGSIAYMIISIMAFDKYENCSLGSESSGHEKTALAYYAPYIIVNFALALIAIILLAIPLALLGILILLVIIAIPFVICLAVLALFAT